MRILILVLSMCLAVGCTVDAAESTTESEMRRLYSYCDGWELCVVYVSNYWDVIDTVCSLSAECVGTEEGIAQAQEHVTPLTAVVPGCPKCHGSERRETSAGASHDSPRGLVIR